MKASSHHTLPSYAVGLIYAGGYGTRLWPVSTRDNPKQVNPLFTGHPLVVEAYERARTLFKPHDIFLVVTHNLFHKIYQLLDLPRENYIIQPQNDDTAIAMGLAAVYLSCLRPGSIAVTFYSDHRVTHLSAYCQAIRQGVRAARSSGGLVTVGTVPEFPNPHFGYIKLGKKLGAHLYQSERFIEKPSIATAKKYLAHGDYVWNTGLYIWSADHMLDIYKTCAPDVYRALDMLRKDFFNPSFMSEVERVYKTVRRTSFDRAVSEKLRTLLVVVSTYHWSDIGTWSSVYELTSKDRSGHAVLTPKPKRFISLDSHNCLVSSSKKTIALVGVDDIYIIETDSALLVCSKEHAAAIKRIAEQST